MGELGYVHSFVLEYGISLIDKIFFCEICTKNLQALQEIGTIRVGQTKSEKLKGKVVMNGGFTVRFI